MIPFETDERQRGPRLRQTGVQSDASFEGVNGVVEFVLAIETSAKIAQCPGVSRSQLERRPEVLFRFPEAFEGQVDRAEVVV